MNTMPRPKVTFWVEAPDDAPKEIRGYTCYFRPERLELTVTPTHTYVTAHGPATRVSHRQGQFTWSIQGLWGDELPDWMLLPQELLARAEEFVRLIEAGGNP